MARITYVKSAQQRYATVPVLGEDGQPVRIPLTNGDGSPKLTKTGRPVTITRTLRDTTRPLPMPTCDFPGCKAAAERDGDRTIRVGDSYKHISPRSGPYGGRTLTRHEVCPTWNVWDYSSSTSANVARIQSEIDELLEAEFDVDVSAAEELRDQAAELARELLEEKEENLSNLPDGLQETGELYEQVQALESWVDDIEGADIPEVPEAEVEQVTRWFVFNSEDGSRVHEDGHNFETEAEAQADIDAYLAKFPDADPDELYIEEQEVEEGDEGYVDPDIEEAELSDEQAEEWRDEVRDAIRDAAGSCEL